MALVVAFVACDLQHYPQRRYCQSADGDPAKCTARPDWCILDGGPSCTGQTCPARYCAPTAGSCVARETSQARCPEDDRFLAGDRVADLSRFASWKRKDLSDEAWALSGKKLTRAIVEGLPEKDRRQLCGSVFEPCRLEWDQAASRPRCRLRADACSACTFVTQPYRCYAKNLCSGVICF